VKCRPNERLQIVCGATQEQVLGRQLSFNLDLLRAVAVTLVLAQHLVNRFYFAKLGLAGPPIGTFGVLIFFVHTCLVLMYSMERSGLEGLPLALNFYIRRIFRIYPLSMLAVLTAVALHLDSGWHGVPGLSHVAHIELGRIFSNLLLIQNMVRPGSIINVLWSLPYEVQMYVFLPILFLWIGRRRISAQLLCVLWALSALLAFGHMQLSGGTGYVAALQRLNIVRYFPNFLPGIIAFRIGHVGRIKSFLWLPFIAVLVIVYVLIPLTAVGWILCLVLGIAIPFFGEIRTSWLRWISHRIATYSYGIYLSHQFAIWFVSDEMGSLPIWSRAAILILLVVGLPIALYHGIEKPMIKVGIRMAEKRGTKQAAVAAVA
jgi:peptidoglycan/LPS O-acetylase OafA/YrhL